MGVVAFVSVQGALFCFVNLTAVWLSAGDGFYVDGCQSDRFVFYKFTVAYAGGAALLLRDGLFPDLQFSMGDGK